MLPQEINRRVGKRAYLIIDSTIEAKHRNITIRGYTQHTADFKESQLPALKKISIWCNGRKNILKVMSTRAEVSKVGTVTIALSQP